MDEAKPAAVRRIFGLTFLPAWGSSGTLAICLFLPLCLIPSCQIQGCQAAPTPPPPPTPLSPYELYRSVKSPGELFFVTAFYEWPYFFGLLVCGATLVIAATGQPRYFRALWFALAVVVAVGSVGMWLYVGEQIRNETDKPSGDRLGELLIILVPTVLFCTVLVATYFNCRTWLAAAMWVQLTLAISALLWFTLIDQTFPLLWGGRLSQAACLALAVGTIIERRRAFKTLGVPPR